MRKVIGFFVLLVLFIVGCSSAGNCAPSETNSIKIGSLPNGSAVYLSNNNLPVTESSPTQAIIYLVGGSDNESFTVNFTTSKLQYASLKVNKTTTINNNGISVTPNPCILGTSGSGFPSSCKVDIAVSSSTYPGTYNITPTAASTGGVETILSPITVLVSGSIRPSTKAITSFSLNGTTGVITGTDIALTMPFGTAVSSLIATYITTGSSVTVSGVTQNNGVSANNFTSPVIYTVHAEDGSTQNYTVTVTVAANTDKTITTFSLDGTSGVISGTSIALTMPYGTDVTGLIATFTTTGASVTVGATPQISAITTNNFTNPVTYTVHAADGSTQNYTVTVTVAANSDNNLVEFSLNGTLGVVNQDNNTIVVVMPYGTSDLSSLTATYLTDGESVTVNGVEQVNGVTPNDFTNSVIYTVHAQNGETKDYAVSVTVKAVISQATSLAFSGNYAYLTSSTSSDITKCSVVNESQLTSCSNISLGDLLPQGAANISAVESTGGTTLYIMGNETPPSIVQCLIPTGTNTPTCLTINPLNGLNSARLLLSSTVDPKKSAKITAFSVSGVAGWIGGSSIYVTLPYGSNLNNLAATFTTTGKTVKVNNVLQVSGVTTNNFTTSPLQYIVTAKDGTTTSAYNVYVRWTAFAGVVLNPYASSLKVPMVSSSLESTMLNMSLIESNGMYVGLNYGYIESFPAEMNATGLSSISLATYESSSVLESYNYIMTNIAESKVYACSVNESATEMRVCSAATYTPGFGAIPQPSSAVIFLQQTTRFVPGVFMVASYSQNTLTGCYMTPSSTSISCDTDPTHQLDMTGVFNLPRSLSLNSAGNLLFALNDGDNSYVACPISGGQINKAFCRKTYFSSL